MLAALLGSASPEIAQIAVPVERSTPRARAPKSTTSPTVRAFAFYESVRANAIDRALLTSVFSAELTPETTRVLAAALHDLGSPSGFVERAHHAADGATIYDFTATLPAGTIAVTFGIDDATDAISKFYVRRATAAATPAS